MPGVLHEFAATNLARLIVSDLEPLVLAWGIAFPLSFTGAGGFDVGNGRRKEADASLRPNTRVGQAAALPSFVIEVGVSERLNQLRCDAHIWLSEPTGSVGVVLLIKVNGNRSIIIEQWESIPRPLRRAGTPATRPTRVNRVDLTQGRCVGAPISINLASIFDAMPAGVPNNATLVLTAQALNNFYNYYWLNM